MKWEGQEVGAAGREQNHQPPPSTGRYHPTPQSHSRIATHESKSSLVAPILMATPTIERRNDMTAKLCQQPFARETIIARARARVDSHPCNISSLPSPMMCKPTTFWFSPWQINLYEVGCLSFSSSMAKDMALNCRRAKQMK